MSTLVETPNYHLPLPYISNTLAEDVERIIDALGLVDTALNGQQSQLDENDFTILANDASGTFSEEGLVLTWVETLHDNRTRTTTYSYTAGNLVNTETVVIGARQRVITYAYDINNRLSGWTTTET